MTGDDEGFVVVFYPHKSLRRETDQLSRVN